MFKLFLKNDKGEAYVGESVKIVIAIVLGAALLAGAVLVFNRVVLPNVETAIETGFGLSDEATDTITHPEYANIVTYMKNSINAQFDAMDAEERASFEAEMNEARADSPEAFPSDFKIDDFRDGETFMNVCYAYNYGITYDEAVAFSKTSEGKATYAEFYDGWFG